MGIPAGQELIAGPASVPPSGPAWLLAGWPGAGRRALARFSRPACPGVRRGQGEIVMLPGSLAWFPALSVTVMVNVNVPAVVGVPPRWPVVRTTPSGSWPTETVQVNGPTPPEVKKF